MTLDLTQRWAVIEGDCLDVMRQLPDGCVDAVVTDPPYCSGGRQQASARNVISKADGREADEWFISDNMGTDTYIRWMRQIANESIRCVTLGSQALVFTDWRQYTNLVTAWESVGWSLRGCIVWDKAKGGAMGSYWRNNHEWICAFTKGAPRPLRHGGFFNTWRGTKPQGGEHPTEKPIELMRYLCESVAPNDSLILDPFVGSGTTGIGAVKERHRFLGIERERSYAEIARRRIADAAAQGSLFDAAT